MRLFDFEVTDGKPGGSALLDRLIDRIDETFESLVLAVTNARIVTVTFPLATTDLSVRHGLKGPPVSWEVVDKTGDVNVWRSTSINPNPLTQIIMQASAPAVVKIRFS